MEGYSVTEAASVLGVPSERVWELLARGVLAGRPEGESGMRVFLQPRPASASSTMEMPPPSPPPVREPERELSPFRELLTEFRNLTERYGQALLALGEARGEVASLRSRVDLLEARMDLRLPMGAAVAGPPLGWASPPRPVFEPSLEPPLASEAEVTEGVLSAEVEPVAESVPSAAEESVPSEADDEPEVADVGDVAAGETDEATDRQRRRRGTHHATESFAEALARAEDPTVPELPEPHREPIVEVAAAEVALPRELPVAEPMPTVDAVETLGMELGGPAAWTEAEEAPESVARTEAEAAPESVARTEAGLPSEPAESAEPIAAGAPATAFDADPAFDADSPFGEPAVAALDEPWQPEPWSSDAATGPALAEPEELELEAQPGTVEPAAAGEPEPAWPAEEVPEPATAAAGPDRWPEASDLGDVEFVAELEPTQASEAVEESELEAAQSDTGAAEPMEPPTAPLTWDPERYTTIIGEPDWYAEEESGTAVVQGPTSDSSSEGAGEPPDEGVAAASSEPAASVHGVGADGSSEMEVAASGHAAEPSAPDAETERQSAGDAAEDALTALDALGRSAGIDAPPPRPAPWSTAGREAEATPRPPNLDPVAEYRSGAVGSVRPAPTPATRAYRRLRRIFPG